MGKNRNKSDKNKMRDALTGKRIGNKEVIIVENAVDYVKKQGYLVVRPRFIEQVTMMFFFMTAVTFYYFGVS